MANALIYSRPVTTMSGQLGQKFKFQVRQLGALAKLAKLATLPRDCSEARSGKVAWRLLINKQKKKKKKKKRVYFIYIMQSQSLETER